MGSRPSGMRAACSLLFHSPATSGSPVKALLCRHFGTADDLVVGDVADPVAGPGEVVARVAAVGLNFFDTLIIAGKYQTKPPFPFSPGGEFAGVVESVGAGVTEFQPGDRVMGYTNFNAARERTAASRAPVVNSVRSTGYGAARVTKKCWIAFDKAMNKQRLRHGPT